MQIVYDFIFLIIFTILLNSRLIFWLMLPALNVPVQVSWRSFHSTPSLTLGILGKQVYRTFLQGSVFITRFLFPMSHLFFCSHKIHSKHILYSLQCTYQHAKQTCLAVKPWNLETLSFCRDSCRQCPALCKYIFIFGQSWAWTSGLGLNLPLRFCKVMAIRTDVLLHRGINRFGEQRADNCLPTV